MKRWAQRSIFGFTIVELLIVIVVIGILAVVSALAYNGVQKHASSVKVASAVKDAADAVITQTVRDGNLQPTGLPASFKVPTDVSIEYIPYNSKHYSGLSSVQNGVFLYEICKELVQNPYYSTIHSSNGSQTSSIVMSCDDSIQSNRLQITGWDTKRWNTPLAKSQLEDYVTSVPYDSWWIDKQEVIRRFYNALIVRYTTGGGSWPITSFWDPWANQWSGVQKQELPAPDASTGTANFCLKATSTKYPDVIYIVTADDTTPRTGSCT